MNNQNYICNIYYYAPSYINFIWLFSVAWWGNNPNLNEQRSTGSKRQMMIHLGGQIKEQDTLVLTMMRYSSFIYSCWFSCLRFSSLGSGKEVHMYHSNIRKRRKCDPVKNQTSPGKNLSPRTRYGFTVVCSLLLMLVHIESLIVWQEPGTEDDLALSFSDKQSCKDFWYVLAYFQYKSLVLTLL